jgi:hypothetical protein
MKMEQTKCSETSAIKHHTPGNNPKDYTQRLEQGESLKSRNQDLSIFRQHALYSMYTGGLLPGGKVNEP